MSKILDTKLIEAVEHDLQVQVVEARFLEELALKGLSNQSVIGVAKKKLGLSEDESVLDNSENKHKELMVLKQKIHKINNLTNLLEGDTMVTEEELKSLAGIEERLAVKIAGILDLDLEDIYIYKD